MDGNEILLGTIAYGGLCAVLAGALYVSSRIALMDRHCVFARFLIICSGLVIYAYIGCASWVICQWLTVCFGGGE